VFPSSGGGEAPSLTIEALALRTTAKLGSAIKSGVDRRQPFGRSRPSPRQG